MLPFLCVHNKFNNLLTLFNIKQHFFLYVKVFKGGQESVVI